MHKGMLLIISGPSGSGKGCITKKLSQDAQIHLSISATTRSPRLGETDGVEYYFLSKEEFLSRVQKGDMLEYNEYCGNYYGTPKHETVAQLEEGKNVVLEIDVNGAQQLKGKVDTVNIFVMPPSMEVLEKRLQGRGTEDKAAIEVRLAHAKKEIQKACDYDYVIINDDLNMAVLEIHAIMIAHQHRLEQMKPFLEGVLKDE